MVLHVRLHVSFLVGQGLFKSLKYSRCWFFLLFLFRFKIAYIQLMIMSSSTIQTVYNILINQLKQKTFIDHTPCIFQRKEKLYKYLFSLIDMNNCFTIYFLHMFFKTN